MAKNHELLAVEGTLRSAFKNILQETAHTYDSKAAHFQASVKSDHPDDENTVPMADEHLEMVDTVEGKLRHMMESAVIPFVDAVAQKETTNQRAKAHLMVDNIDFGILPATFLLGFADKLKEIRSVISKIPTLKPGIAWDPDEQHEKSATGKVYVARHNIERKRTKKTVKHKVLYESTKEHPAQIEKWNEDETVGKIVERIWSSCMSPSDKSKLLAFMDRMIDETVKARTRANEEEVVDVHVGESLFNGMKAAIEG